MTETNRWLKPAPDGGRFAAALGIGLLIELGAVLALLPVLTHQVAPSPVQTVIKLSIVAPPAPKPPPAPAPKPLPPPKPVPPPPPLPVAPPMPPPPPIARPAQHVLRHYTRPRVHTPPPVTPPPVVQPQPPVPPPPAQPAAPPEGELDLFRSAMRAAVQAVANQVYPQAAQLAHETGQPQVTFTYLDGSVTDIALAQSSGFPLLDQAALTAARMAHYPPPPAGFAGRTYQITVSVIFQMSDAPDVDGD